MFEEEWACSIREYGVHGKTIKRKLYAADRKERYFHLYYNSARASSQKRVVIRTKEAYDSATAGHKKLLDKRDALRRDEIMAAVVKGKKTMKKLWNFWLRRPESQLVKMTKKIAPILQNRSDELF